jgi:hypothetical protein
MRAMWTSVLKTTYSGAEEQVAIFRVLPKLVYANYAEDIREWTFGMQSGSFNFDAAYNIVPVSFAPETASFYKIPMVSLDPEEDFSHLYAGAYENILIELRKNKLSIQQKGKAFVAVHSYFRNSLSRDNDNEGIDIEKFLLRNDLTAYFAANRQMVAEFLRQKQ